MKIITIAICVGFLNTFFYINWTMSGYSGYVQPLAGLHLPTRDGCPTSTSVPQLLSSTQFGSVQPQVSALASDTAGAGAAVQWSSVANDAAASSPTA